MSTHGAVLAAIAKQREKQEEREALKAKEREIELQKAKEEHLAKVAQEKRERAWLELQQAFASGDDSIAAGNAGKVNMELLAQVRHDGYNAMHCAAAQGLVECCKVILKRRDFQASMLVAQDKRGWTPLHCAVTSADNGAEICALLAIHGACRVGIKDHEGRSAVDLAQEWGLAAAKTAILDAIAERYAKVQEKQHMQEAQAAEVAQMEQEMLENRPEEMGATAGFRLIKQGRIQDTISLIRSAWPFINQIDDDQSRCRSLLHHAAHRGEPDVCEAILDRQDWRQTDHMDLDRATALHVAAATRQIECCIAIVSSGRCKQVNSTDMRDQTALHLAALRGDGECYNAILAHEDIDLSVRDYKNKLAAEYAIERGLEVDMPIIYRQDERDLAVDDPDLQVDL